MPRLVDLASEKLKRRNCYERDRTSCDFEDRSFSRRTIYEAHEEIRAVEKPSSRRDTETQRKVKAKETSTLLGDFQEFLLHSSL